MAEAPGPTGVAEESRSGWARLVGRRESRTRAIAGVWALHPFEPQFPELEWTRGFGFVWDQWLGATFINSYGSRGFIGALERHWWMPSAGPVDFGVGYRMGVVTGYDERLFELAGQTPVLPFGGLLIWAESGPVSLDVFYAYRGITVESAVRLR